MKQVFLTISNNEPLTADVWRMTLAGDCSGITAPGQFINLRLDGFYLRRPISVCHAGESFVTILYKVMGQGTDYMTSLQPGKKLDVLTGLGNGFSTEEAGDAPLLIGGGVGLPPMYMLARKLLAEGRQPRAVLGFNRSSEMFYINEFSALGIDVTVATADGSCGVPGFVTDALPKDYSYFYCCGPIPMLKAVYSKTVTSGQFSFEERMGCGFGACMGCSIQTVSGPKRVCKDGPIFRKEEILWEPK